MSIRKSRINLCLYVLIVCVLALSGCARQQRYEPVGQIYVGNAGKVRAMEAAEHVLAKMHFTIDKADVESGFIRTRPLPGAQPFEFWRSDNIGSFNASEASLHSIRRIAELSMSREGKRLRIDCNVKTQRLSMPERKTSGSGHAYGLFSQSGPSIQKLKFSEEQKPSVAWLDLGPDEQLATEILRRIEERIEQW